MESTQTFRPSTASRLPKRKLIDLTGSTASQSAPKKAKKPIVIPQEIIADSEIMEMEEEIKLTRPRILSAPEQTILQKMEKLRAGRTELQPSLTPGVYGDQPEDLSLPSNIPEVTNSC